MAVIVLRSDLMVTATDARLELAHVLGIEENDIRVLKTRGHGDDEQVVLSAPQARHLAVLARAGKSVLESGPYAVLGGRVT